MALPQQESAAQNGQALITASPKRSGMKARPVTCEVVQELLSVMPPIQAHAVVDLRAYGLPRLGRHHDTAVLPMRIFPHLQLNKSQSTPLTATSG